MTQTAEEKWFRLIKGAINKVREKFLEENKAHLPL